MPRKQRPVLWSGASPADICSRSPDNAEPFLVTGTFRCLSCIGQAVLAKRYCGLCKGCGAWICAEHFKPHRERCEDIFNGRNAKVRCYRSAARLSTYARNADLVTEFIALGRPGGALSRGSIYVDDAVALSLESVAEVRGSGASSSTDVIRDAYHQVEVPSWWSREQDLAADREEVWDVPRDAG